MDADVNTPSRLVWNPEAKRALQGMYLSEKYWVGELSRMLDGVNPTGCPRVRFQLAHPNEKVSMIVEVVDNLFVVQMVTRGAPRAR
jgi:hypothetical protein